MAHKIYHANTRETRFEETPIGEKINFERDWVLVCEVDVPFNLDTIYEVCNQTPWLEVAWYEVDQVKLVDGLEGARSLSVGDIIVRDGSDVLIQVGKFGFQVVLSK